MFRLHTMARRAAALALTLSLAASALGVPLPSATAAEPEEPAARLHVILHEVTIHDDRDGVWRGAGEMYLSAHILGCNPGVPAPCLGRDDHGLMVSGEERFSASTGQTITLNRGVPQKGDTMHGANTTEVLGLAVFGLRQYTLLLVMKEHDDNRYDQMQDLGRVPHAFDVAERGLGLGTHTARSVRDDGSSGDYTITYEIRRAPVPDLRFGGLEVHDLPGRAEKRVCMGIQNVEAFSAGPFEVTLRVNGVVPAGGTARAPYLLGGTSIERCVEVALPTSGRHTLTARVDEPRTVFEFNEANNVYDLTYEPIAPAAAPSPTPGMPRPDLTVSAIEVNGNVPDGKDDCAPGKNKVTIVVKNEGQADAADFGVRLVDDAANEIWEKSVSDLRAGKEREIKFDVRLKPGARLLVAKADPRQEVAEVREDNNELQVSARCKGDAPAT